MARAGTTTTTAYQASVRKVPALRSSLSGILCEGLLTSQCDKALTEDNGELRSCSTPFTRRHFPILADLAQDQKHQL